MAGSARPASSARARADSPFFWSKFRIPQVPDHFVSRARLLTLLDDLSGYPVTAIVAPGGAGKTALAADWVRHQGLPCAWLSLDESDHEPAQLWRALMTAADAAAPGVAERARQLAGSRSGLAESMTALAEDLDGAVADPSCWCSTTCTWWTRRRAPARSCRPSSSTSRLGSTSCCSAGVGRRSPVDRMRALGALARHPLRRPALLRRRGAEDVGRAVSCGVGRSAAARGTRVRRLGGRASALGARDPLRARAAAAAWPGRRARRRSTRRRVPLARGAARRARGADRPAPRDLGGGPGELWPGRSLDRAWRRRRPAGGGGGPRALRHQLGRGRVVRGSGPGPDHAARRARAPLARSAAGPARRRSPLARGHGGRSRGP